MVVRWLRRNRYRFSRKMYAQPGLMKRESEIRSDWGKGGLMEGGVGGTQQEAGMRRGGAAWDSSGKRRHTGATGREGHRLGQGETSTDLRKASWVFYEMEDVKTLCLVHKGTEWDCKGHLVCPSSNRDWVFPEVGFPSGGLVTSSGTHRQCCQVHYVKKRKELTSSSNPESPTLKPRWLSMTGMTFILRVLS